MENSLQDNIMIRLPIKIAYDVLEKYLRDKMIGEHISNYAEILDISLNRSLEEGYDLALDLKFKTSTTFFRNKEASVTLHACINFDAIEQEVMVKDYKLEGNSNSWLMNNSLEALVNTFLHKKIKEKMKFNFRPHIEKQLISLNKKLENPLEATKGIYLSGYLNNFSMREIIPGDMLLLVFVEIESSALVDIKSLDF